MTDQWEDHKKCPFCAELILKEAIKCRFCLSDLGDTCVEKKDRAGIGLGRLMLYNLMFPGLGAYRAGFKKRGVITCLIIAGMLVLYLNTVIPALQKGVQKSLRTGNVRYVKIVAAEVEDNPYLDLAFYGYILSFIDLYFLTRSRLESSK